MASDANKMDSLEGTPKWQSDSFAGLITSFGPNLLWLKDVMEKHVNEFDALTDLYKNLLNTAHMYRMEFGQDAANELINVLEACSNTNHARCVEILECMAAVLGNENYTKHFAQNGNPDAYKMFIRTGMRFDTLVAPDVTSKFFQVICGSIAALTQSVVDRNKLSEDFVENLMVPLAEYFTTSIRNDKKSYRKYLVACYDAMIYPDGYDNSDLFNVTVNEEGWTIPERNYILNKMARIVGQHSPNVVAECYFAFLSTLAKHDRFSGNSFRMTLILCNFLGIVPVAIRGHTLRKTEHLFSNEYFPAAVNFLEYVATELFGKNIDLTSQVAGVNFDIWVCEMSNLMIRNIVSDPKYFETTVNSMRALRILFELSNPLMDSRLSDFIRNVMLIVKCPQHETEYAKLLKSTTRYFANVNRLSKFFFELLRELAIKLPRMSSNEMPSKVDILPIEVMDQIGHAITSSSSISKHYVIFTTLFHRLNGDCVLELRKSVGEIDEKLALTVDLIIYVIRRLVSSIKLPDESSLQEHGVKILDMMNQLANNLHDLGKAMITRPYNERVCTSFLRLCHTWGEMKLIFIAFDPEPMRIRTERTHSSRDATNLTLHLYLDEYTWNIISQRVTNFGGEKCIKAMNNLVLQKLESLSSMEDETGSAFSMSEDVAANCAKYIVHNSSAKWICQNVSKISEVLKTPVISDVAEKILLYLESMGNDPNEMCVIRKRLRDNFGNCRPLLLIIIFQIFKKIAKNLKKGKARILYEAIQKLNLDVLVSLQESFDHYVNTGGHLTYLDELKCIETGDTQLDYDEVLSNMVPSVVQSSSENTTIKFSVVNRLTKLLKILPVRSIGRINRSFLSVLCLAVIKDIIRARGSENEIRTSVEDALKFMGDSLRDGLLSDEVDMVPVLLWIKDKLSPTYDVDYVLQSLCQSFIHSEASFKSLYWNPFPDESKMSSRIVDVAALYLNSVKENYPKDYHKKAQLMNELREKCTSILLNYFQNLDAENLMEGHDDLAYFTTLLESISLGNSSQSSSHQRVENIAIIYIKKILLMDEELNKIHMKFVATFVDRFSIFKSFKEVAYDLWVSIGHFLPEEPLIKILNGCDRESHTDILRYTVVCAEMCLPPSVSESNNLKSLSVMWRAILSASRKGRVHSTNTAIEKELYPVISSELNSLLADSEHFSTDLAKAILEIFNCIVKNSALDFSYRMLDLEIQLLDVLRSKSDLHLVVNSLLNMCAYRPAMFLDRLPAFLVLYISMFENTLQQSASSLSAEEILVACAHKLEKATDVISSHKIALKIVSPGTLNELLKAYSAHSNASIEVKMHLKNALYRWIDICGKTALDELRSELEQPANHLLRTLESEYERFIRYSGRV